MPVLFVFLIIILLFFIFLFLKIYLEIVYTMGDKNIISLKIMLLGKLIRIPLDMKKDKNIEKEIIKKYQNIISFFDYLDFAGKVTKKLLKAVKVDLLEVKLYIGTEDAAKTGIITGTIWGVIYNLYGILNNLLTVGNTNFDINPDFDNERLEGYTKSIISTRPVNIIVISIIVFKFMSSKRRNELKDFKFKHNV